MDDNKIYELINDSFSSEFKPDFADVKNRIASQTSARPVEITPTMSKRRLLARVIPAAAACLVVVAALGIVISSTGNKTSENSASVNEAVYSAEDACDTSADGDMIFDSAEQSSGVFASAFDESYQSKDLDALSDGDISDSDLSDTDD